MLYHQAIEIRRKIYILEVIQEFLSQKDKLSNLMAVAGKHFRTLANCFKHEFKGSKKRIVVNIELIKIEALSQQDST